MEIIEEGKKKKGGRGMKKQKKAYELNRKQAKFFVDLGNESKSLELVHNLLLKINQKELGRELTFKDLSVYAIGKLSEKDIEKLQESSLSEMERVEKAYKEFKAKTKIELSLGEFLVKKLNIN